MTWRSRRLLRLSGRLPEKAPEMKSTDDHAAAIFRRFFSVLARFDPRQPGKDTEKQDERRDA